MISFGKGISVFGYNFRMITKEVRMSDSGNPPASEEKRRYLRLKYPSAEKATLIIEGENISEIVDI